MKGVEGLQFNKPKEGKKRDKIWNIIKNDPNYIPLQYELCVNKYVEPLKHDFSYLDYVIQFEDTKKLIELKNGTLVAIGNSGRVNFLDKYNTISNSFAYLQIRASSVVELDNSNLVIYCKDGGILIWDQNTLMCISVLEKRQNKKNWRDGTLMSLPNDQLLLVTNEAKIYDLKSKQLIHKDPSFNNVITFIKLKNGTLLFSRPNSLEIYNSKLELQIKKTHTFNTSSLCELKDEQIALAHQNKILILTKALEISISINYEREDAIINTITQCSDEILVATITEDSVCLFTFWNYLNQECLMKTKRDTVHLTTLLLLSEGKLATSEASKSGKSNIALGIYFWVV